MATSPLIDADMVDEVTKLGFDREEVIQSVKHRQQNKVQRLAVTVIAASSKAHCIYFMCRVYNVLHCACLR